MAEQLPHRPAAARLPAPDRLRGVESQQPQQCVRLLEMKIFTELTEQERKEKIVRVLKLSFANCVFDHGGHLLINEKASNAAVKEAKMLVEELEKP